MERTHYTLKINFSDLPRSEDKVKRWNETSVFNYCRKLISEGVDPNTRLEVYRDRDEPDLIIRNIGIGAKLRVSGSRFKLWTEDSE